MDDKPKRNHWPLECYDAAFDEPIAINTTAPHTELSLAALQLRMNEEQPNAAASIRTALVVTFLATDWQTCRQALLDNGYDAADVDNYQRHYRYLKHAFRSARRDLTAE